MSWVFSRELCEQLNCLPEPAAESLPGKSLAGKPSLPLKSTNMQGMYWSPVKTTSALPLSRSSGATYEILTRDRGEAALTLWREAFHVPKCLPPEPEPASRAKAVAFGRNLGEPFAKADQNGHSWRTSQISLLAPEGMENGDLERYCSIWPRWGLMSRGECWELSKASELPTRETESGSSVIIWPTPTATCNNAQVRGVGQTIGTKRGTTLAGAVKQWPTPTANEDAAGTPEGQMQWMLTHAAKTGCLSREQYEQMKASRATDAGKTSSTGAVTTTGNGSAKIVETGPILSTTSSKKVASHAVREMFPTPTSRDWKDGPGMSLESKNPDGSIRKRDDLLPRRLFSQGHTGGQLNPAWVESYLMGWPLNWTSTVPMAPEAFPAWQRAFVPESNESNA